MSTNYHCVLIGECDKPEQVEAFRKDIWKYEDAIMKQFKQEGKKQIYFITKNNEKIYAEIFTTFDDEDEANAYQGGFRLGQSTCLKDCCYDSRPDGFCFYMFVSTSHE